MSELRILNRQKTRRIRSAFLGKITRHLLANLPKPGPYELAVHLIDPPEMTRLNETFLGHEGSTDVITFDNSEPGEKNAICGELFISVADAITQARQFQATWEMEVVRYVVHGVLHLLGYDDLQPAPRRAMKREENRLTTMLSRQFDLKELERPPSSRPSTPRLAITRLKTR